MGYAIVGGQGLLLSLGLMAWGLMERSKRHAAERKADKAEALRVKAVAIADQNGDKAKQLALERQRLEMQLGALRIRLDEAWESLAKTGDPKAVKDWLDKELAEEEL